MYVRLFNLNTSININYFYLDFSFKLLSLSAVKISNENITTGYFTSYFPLYAFTFLNKLTS